MIGIGILSYNRLDDLMRCVRSIKFRTKGLPIEIMVFDNSDKTDMPREYIQKAHPEVILLTDPNERNIGCTRSRNIMYQTFKERHPNSDWLVIMDQDVEVHHGWLHMMLRTAWKYPQAGIVAWPVANMRPSYVDMKNGCITAAASLCHLHRMQALNDVDGVWRGPWDPRFFFFRFDSLMCDRMNLLGWRTHIILDLYKQGVPWEKQPGLITHHHPHQGVKSNPNYLKITRASDRLYRRIQREEGWRPFDPRKDPYLMGESNGSGPRLVQPR